jgi:hypothetical protein
VPDVLCPHCGQTHPPEVVFCPTSGHQVVAAVAAVGPPPPPQSAASPAMPEKGVADILKEAYELYRKHARMLLTTCALLLVPAAIVNSCARALILGPTVVGVGAISASTAELEASARALQDAAASHADPATLARLQAENARRIEEISRKGLAAAGAAMGSLGLWLLGVLGTLVTSIFLYGIAIPLTNGALTIAAADRVLGGSAGWREVWMLLFRRLGILLSAVIPAALLIGVGTVFLVVPGIILGLLFSFVSPVVLIEGLRGRAALRRSVELVKSDWLRVAIVIFVFGLLCGLARIVALVLIPRSAIFALSLFGDLFTLVLMPVPVLGLVLLYFDIRRRREGFTPDRLRADLEALKTA